MGFLVSALPWGKILAVGAVLAVLAAAWWHYTGLQSDLREARERVFALTVENQVQDATITNLEGVVSEWAAHAEALRRTNEAMAAAQTAAAAEQRKLNDVLARHDLEALSLAKPGLLERRINSGTARILGLFECASGGGEDCAGGSGAAGE
jgi:hypothetical protein